VLALLAVVVGLFARVAGLWHRPLAVDEYYFLLSTQSILADGIPDLPGGGYYVRGILIQYLTAGIIALTQDPMLGLRLVPTVFGLGCVGLGFVYGSQLGGRGMGICLAAVLLLSSWEVEFSLFGRMYAPLQFLTLLFLVGYTWTLDGRGGWRRYVAPVAAVLAIGTHSLAVLLVPLLFLPVLLPSRLERFGGRRPLWLYAAAAAAAAAFCLWWQFGFADGLRNWGVTNAFPADFRTGPAPPGQGGPLLVPVFPFWHMTESPIQQLGLLLAATGGGGILGVAVLRRLRRDVGYAHGFAIAAVIAALLHQLSLAAVLALVVILHYRSELKGSRALMAGVGLVPVISAGWLAFAWLSTYGWGDRSWIGRAGEQFLTQAVHRSFFGWPDVWSPTLDPWFQSVPLLTVLLVPAVLASAWWGGSGHPAAAVRHPAFVVLYMAVTFGVLNQLYYETRYWYFLYPAMIAAMLLAAAGSAERLTGVRSWAGRHGLRAGTVGLAAGLGLFAMTDDFNPLHLVRITTADVRYRIHAFERYERQWYDREDTETLAALVNDRVSVGGEDATVIVADVPQASYFLDMPHGIFYPRDHDRFRNVSRSVGTVDFWSGQRLLSTDEELREYSRRSTVVWVLWKANVQRRFRVFDIEAVWGDRLLGVDAVHTGEDGAFEVLRVELTPASSASRPPSPPSRSSPDDALQDLVEAFRERVTPVLGEPLVDLGTL
jgi:hypothetical protein